LDAWGDIRLKARALHAEAMAHTNGDRRGVAIIAAVFELHDLQRRDFNPGEKAGEGVQGFLERDARTVNIVRGLEAPEEALVLAHEIGHFILHTDDVDEVLVASPALGGDLIDSGANHVTGYSARARKEMQAEIFAGEFLCPGDWIKERWLAGTRPHEVADDLGLPPDLVMNQAIRGILLPPLSPPPAAKPMPAVKLDDSQAEAAAWSQGPLLVDAGPGTGKTRTLVHRVGGLLDQGAPSSSILALTFSNKAAEEMRERLSAAHADASIQMWVGTFHAFGLELLTKHAALIERTEKMHVLDQDGSLALLEDNLDRLPLQHYLNLIEPAYDLVHVLQAISRAKDEMVSADEYCAAAAADLAASTDDTREAAEKAAEVGAIYKAYEQLLREADAVDFGDLIKHSAELLQKHPEVQEHYRQQYAHVLVDEYQDVNLASAKLLQALTGPGRDVWVVADRRQSIYRFRGAQPSNVDRFQEEFAGQTRSLKVNYRSSTAIVRTFEAFAAGMGGGAWEAARADLGPVSLSSAAGTFDEAAAIKAKIEEFRSQGIDLRDQAILARSHLTLARITSGLERLGVPLLYLGDLFERDEIRDLLSLLSIGAEFGGIGLVRVAQLPQYAAPKADVLLFLEWCRAADIDALRGLRRLDEVTSLSQAGLKALSQLNADLAGTDNWSSPWVVLTTWLFESSSYLAPLIESTNPNARQKLVAIYHLLKVCDEFASLGEHTRQAFLRRIRRIEALNRDTPYRAVASEAADYDAVRVSTVHASKGLEFRAVHLPGLATRYTPLNRQGVRCPPPTSLSHLTVGVAGHDAEEECLFFVALSRAQDQLSLSRADRYTTQNAAPSKFLGRLPHLKERRAPAAATTAGEAVPHAAPPRRQTYEERELAAYDICPARYRYEFIDGLRGASDNTAYLRFHGCVYRVIGWLEERRAAGEAATLSEAQAQLDEEWKLKGPTKHGFNKFYRAAAESMVANIADRILNEPGQYEKGVWQVEVGKHFIELTPDRVVTDAQGRIRVQRVRTGKVSKSEQSKGLYALLRKGAQSRFPGREVSVETYYPASGSTVATSGKDATLLANYTKTIEGIERGDFTPKTGEHCPRCQCYFICGV